MGHRRGTTSRSGPDPGRAGRAPDRTIPRVRGQPAMTLSVESQNWMDLVRAAIRGSDELANDPRMRIAGLVAVLIHELAIIPDTDDQATALRNVHDDLDRLVEVVAAEMSE